MCVFIIMGPVSGFFAGQAGKAIGGKGIKGDVLGGLFGAAGSLLPWYETGGKVTHTGPAMVHKSEYILPANAKPTSLPKPCPGQCAHHFWGNRAKEAIFWRSREAFKGDDELRFGAPQRC